MESNIVYNKFKFILSGCKTIIDAYYFAEIYCNGNNDIKQLVHSMVNGKKYNLVADFRTMKYAINEVASCMYQDEAEQIIEKYREDTCDATQIATLMRIMRTKQKQHKQISIKKNNNQPAEIVLCEKICPHCNHKCKSLVTASYVICGYTNSKNGYDWDGCGKDWCFQCGKKLCKSWQGNKLYVESNRCHNGECCRKTANDNNEDYEMEYCMCTNEFVRRV